MKTSACLFLALAFLIAPACNTQTLKKGERPVFLSAQALGAYCQTFVRIGFHPDGSRHDDNEKLRITTDELIEMSKCYGYIMGWMDQTLQSLDHDPPHYTPVNTETDFKPLIDTFIKYVKDHPEQEAYAASTILTVSAHRVAKAGGSSLNTKEDPPLD